MTDTEAPLDKVNKYQQNTIALEEVDEIDHEDFKTISGDLFLQDEQGGHRSGKQSSQENEVLQKGLLGKEEKTVCQVPKINKGEIGPETDLQDILENILTKETADEILHHEGQSSCSNDVERISREAIQPNKAMDMDLLSELSNETHELFDSRKADSWQASANSAVPDTDSGENQSQKSDGPIFPLSANQSSSFNYLQDLKRRKIKMKKPSANILMTNKLLKIIRQQSKFRSSSQFPLFNSNSRRQENLKFEYDPEGLDISGSRYSHDVGDVFATNEDGQQTSGLYDSTGLYKCHLCPVAFSSSISLRGHMSSHKIQKKFMCPICSRSFAHSSTLNYHIRKHKGDLRYKCDICGKRFLKPFRLKAHISCVHSGEKPYVCTVCKKAFSCSINLTRHMRTHTGERPFLCLLCGKKFRDNSSFALHRRYHSQNRPYECDVCGKGFIKMHFLKTHKKCVHAEDKSHECFICNKSFKVKDYLRKHLITHQENKRYKCDFCEKSFPRIGSLKKHRYLHTGEEPFKCEVCFKGFRDAYTLAKHARLHDRKVEDRLLTGEEGEEKKKALYQCDKCERKYSLSGSLKIHKQKYCKGKKPEGESADFYCSGCGMLFHHKQSLAKHMKMTCESVYGKKDKVFLCSTCGLVFFSRVTLNDHLRTTTCSGKDIPEYYKCNICDATFSHRATLSKHKQLHGEDELAEEEDAKPESEKTGTRSTRHAPLVDETGHRLFECKFCGETFRSKSALYDTHMRRCHGRPAQEKKNACEQCGRKFHSKSDLRAHFRIHTGEKPFTCGVCGKSFTQRGHVSMHMKIHTGQRDFPCTICGKAFQFATTLRNHVKIHTGERPHMCIICGKGFIKSNNLKNHLAKHANKGETSETVIKKEETDDDMNQVMTLNEDNSTVTVSPVKKTASGKLLAQARQGTRKSSRASRGASMKKLIEEEMNTMSELEDIKVEPVDYDDIDNSLEQSLSDEKNGEETEPKIEGETSNDLKCPFCEEDQPSAQELANHIKSHAGSRPFLCKHCGKSFVLASHLQSHMLIHDKKLQEYRCLVCMGSFPTSKILQSHMRTHKGERPYGCYLCDKAYTTSQHLRRHVKSNHPDKLEIDMNVMHIPSGSLNEPKEENLEPVSVSSPVKKDFSCNYCEKQYSKNQHLMRHIRTHHPEMLGEVTNKKKSNPMLAVKIKTEIVWDPESTSAEDTGNPEEKYITPDSLKSSESSDSDTIIQEPASPRPDSPGQERVYVPQRMLQGSGSPGGSASASESESSNMETGDVGGGQLSVTGGQSPYAPVSISASDCKVSAKRERPSARRGRTSASRKHLSAFRGKESEEELSSSRKRMFASEENVSACGEHTFGSGENASTFVENTSASVENKSASGENMSGSGENASDSGEITSALGENMSALRENMSVSGENTSGSGENTSGSGENISAAGSADTEEDQVGYFITIKKEPSDSEYEVSYNNT